MACNKIESPGKSSVLSWFDLSESCFVLFHVVSKGLSGANEKDLTPNTFQFWWMLKTRKPSSTAYPLCFILQSSPYPIRFNTKKEKTTTIQPRELRIRIWNLTTKPTNQASEDVSEDCISKQRRNHPLLRWVRSSTLTACSSVGRSSCLPLCNNAMHNCLSLCNRWQGREQGGSPVYFTLSPWQN